MRTSPFSGDTMMWGASGVTGVSSTGNSGMEVISVTLGAGEMTSMTSGSSATSTGRGHGTDRAIVAGLLGMKPDDMEIPDSFLLARERGLQFEFGEADLKDAHPNSVELILEGCAGNTLEVVAASLGGGRIKICKIDGIETNFCGDYPTLIVHNLDQPGHVTEVTSMLAHKSVNIATMQLYRDCRGGNAVMVLECDQEIPRESIGWLRHLEGILKVTYLSLEEE